MDNFYGFFNNSLETNMNINEEFIFYKVKKNNPLSVNKYLKTNIKEDILKTRSKKNNDFIIYNINKSSYKTILTTFRNIYKSIVEVQIKNEIFYIGPGIILDVNFKSLLIINEKCIYISPSVYTTSTAINKFIQMKLFPYMINTPFTIIIKEQPFAEQITYKPNLLKNLNLNIEKISKSYGK